MKHSIKDLASSKTLWEENIDPDNNAPFDDYTQEEREEIIRESFGSDFDSDGNPHDN